MARYFDIVGGGEAAEGIVVHGSGTWVLYVGMIIMSVSIISMVVFACGHDDDQSSNPKKQKNGGGGPPDCGDCGCWFNGDGGAGCGGGGCAVGVAAAAAVVWCGGGGGGGGGGVVVVAEVEGVGVVVDEWFGGVPRI
ncbi:hypothetical protein Acr_17g0007470 [Actinidia rufa]|uniref:Uncharacterized protein n=1 Tax=Actinidia rufa TaxID=165716 RepID=A0A7J0G312_9ERIC|nr:hypothetical protein Acr_17g0007470 [Actinidia rufa]